MSIDQFWKLTWREFKLYSIAFDRKEIAEWSRVRRICFSIRNSVISKKDFMPETSYWPMPQDPKVVPLSKEYIAQVAEKYSKPTKELIGKA